MKPPATDLEDPIKIAQKIKVTINPNNFLSFRTKERPIPRIEKKKTA